MDVPINRKSKKVILKRGKFINFVRKGSWEYTERSNCTGAVIIVAMTDDKKVIFVEQYRPPVNKNVIEFPAGLINDYRKEVSKRKPRYYSKIKKETLVKAAKRELLEETGYKASRIYKLLQGPSSSGISSDMLVMVRAVGLKKVSSGGGDDFESIKVHEVPLKNTEKWLKNKQKQGCMIGLRLYTGLYFLNKYNSHK